MVLPGSKADVDPAAYHAAKDPKTAPADFKRDAVDDFLLKDAYAKRKPVLGICYGLQILNVYRGGTLLQHIESPVTTRPGKVYPWRTPSKSIAIPGSARLLAAGRRWPQKNLRPRFL